MKVGNITQNELLQAREFLKHIGIPVDAPAVHVMVADMIRATAFYGAIRSHGEDATGCLMVNGKPILVGRDTPHESAESTEAKAGLCPKCHHTEHTPGWCDCDCHPEEWRKVMGFRPSTEAKTQE